MIDQVYPSVQDSYYPCKKVEDSEQSTHHGYVSLYPIILLDDDFLSVTQSYYRFENYSVSVLLIVV